MIFECYEDYTALSERAAEIVINTVKDKKNTVLGLPTGSSPIGMYERISERFKKGLVDFSDVKTFNLDEYCGISSDHEQSYHYFMNTNLFNHVNIKKEHINLPYGNPENPEAFAQEYEEKIRAAGGIDLQILGIGRNGHIGFNEPGTAFGSRTHMIKLHEDTRLANSRFFDSLEDVPVAAITMGIKTIMRARSILLIACGESKQEAMRKLAYGEVTPEFPASVLQLHPDVRILIDEEASKLLEMEDSVLVV
ncbi:MAG TPA: glucosamine-6-phosphate deaminase [Thermotogota bacterium]|nr:glucosamine-6-phosphate deaminase [Thermotogota bacterium]